MADDDGEADNGKQGNHVRDLGPQSVNARCTRFSYATANRLRNLDGNLNEKKQWPMKSIIINQQLASPLSTQFSTAEGCPLYRRFPVNVSIGNEPVENASPQAAADQTANRLAMLAEVASTVADTTEHSIQRPTQPTTPKSLGDIEPSRDCKFNTIAAAVATSAPDHVPMDLEMPRVRFRVSLDSHPAMLAERARYRETRVEAAIEVRQEKGGSRQKEYQSPPVSRPHEEQGSFEHEKDLESETQEERVKERKKDAAAPEQSHGPRRSRRLWVKEAREK
ncbi:predicted protein [Chaetomium globosum CBS 148.51]|uniref:Uncharacterized protein n=1 Tax=Chaetomium globosum (strain ATCC 6205 / CBS 148.51 / DSM 1962 / NBRC 6347 / NRRL 1970) TaxID=306901 RepID=Q2GUP1_CHAGB|nr:uncharacterized protein CHGG_08313 [Chaetomium globosum CBS 148.51]EAQ87060.1 predicted protein [Chaetomium globosum CBS 148.51]